jgi:hypothetical protein
MAGVAYDALLDLLKTTLADYGKDAFEVMWGKQRYEYCERMQNSNFRIDGGTSIKRNIMLDHTGQARFVQMFEVEDTTIGDVQSQMDVPWCSYRTKYAWDKKELLDQRGSQHGFIDLLLSRRTESLWSLADLLEEGGWKGRLSATDTRNPLGVPEALCMMDAAETTPGFKGQTIRYRGGTTGTIFQGIDASTTAKWRNYACVYTTVDNALIKSLTRACLMTAFKPAWFVPQPGKDAIGPRRMYAGVDVVNDMIDIADAKDDNHAPNDARGRVRVNGNGGVMFNGMPLIHIPDLDLATYSPIYAIDWTKLQIIIQDGFHMVEDEPMRAPSQPSVLQVYLNGAYQQLCQNRRTVGFVAHKVTT